MKTINGKQPDPMDFHEKFGRDGDTVHLSATDGRCGNDSDPLEALIQVPSETGRYSVACLNDAELSAFIASAQELQRQLRAYNNKEVKGTALVDDCIGKPVIVASGTTLIFPLRDGLQTNPSNPLLTEALDHLKIDGQDWLAKATMPREAFKALSIYIGAFGDGMEAEARKNDTRATVGKKAAPLMPSDNKTIKTK